MLQIRFLLLNYFYMKQLRIANLQEAENKENCENSSVLKRSAKQNFDFLKSYKNSKDSAKELGNGADLDLLQKSLKSYEETINKQKQQIQDLKAQLESNKSYTSAIQQKYTILLESIQPFQEKVNAEKLVQKIAELENKLQCVQKGQYDATSFKFLKLTEHKTSISAGGLESGNFDQLTDNAEICLENSQNQQTALVMQKIQSKVQPKQTAKSSLDKQQKSRKPSTDSQIGIQVSFPEGSEVPLKRNNIQKYISLDSEMRNNQINLSRKRKNSEFEENLSSLWEKFINDYLNNEQTLTTKFKHKTEHLLKKCIPYELRSTVWPMVFQNPLGITWQFYMELLQRRGKNWVEESVKIQIQKDLNRSFTGKGKQIENKDKLIEQVRQVLELFHVYRPDVSYVQGMTYPTIVLVTVVGKMKAFCILSNSILGSAFFKRIYTFQGLYPSIYCRTFDFLLKDINSSASDMLERKHISSQIFLIEWFYTFFSRGLNFQTILKIWDHLAYFGQVAIFKMAVTVIELVVGYLTDATYEGAMGLIKQFSSYIDQKKLIQAFTNSRVTEQKYRKAYRKAVKSFNNP